MIEIGLRLLLIQKKAESTFLGIEKVKTSLNKEIGCFLNRKELSKSLTVCV
jgi:hypothetical protein